MDSPNSRSRQDVAGPLPRAHDTSPPDAGSFGRYADLGYRRLVPIIPPDAPVSPRSSLHKRLGTSQDGRGKTPGVRGADGDWRGYDWLAGEADERDYRRWHAMGAGVGIRTGAGLLAIDADTTDERHARVIRDVVDRHIAGGAAGARAPVRVGRFPKALYLVRTTEPTPYQRVEFGPSAPNGSGRIWRVETLADKRQFVAEGVHPATREPYTWPRPLVAFDALPVVSPAVITAILEELRTVLPDSGPVVREGSGADVDQAMLRGDPDAVRRAVEATPNTSAHFPSRESYRDYGYAIKAALPDDPDLAFELYRDWCARWQDGENDPDVVAADWSRMHPPYRRGAAWLFEVAAATSGGRFDEADGWLTDLGPDERPVPTDIYPVLTVEAIRTRPPVQWLVDRHIPKNSLGFLYSVPGAGKSFLALDLALHIAAGSPDWHGDTLRPGPARRVLYLASEGGYGLRNRIEAWIARHRPPAVFDHSFLVIEAAINFMAASDVQRLVRTVRSVGPAIDLVVVDTVSRALPGADENLQKDMTLFVRACDAVRQTCGGSVLGIHHAGKSGTMRGSSVLLGAGDFVFRLDRARGASVGVLECEKQKDGPDGWEDAYAFDVAPAGIGESSLVVSRCAGGIGPGAELSPEIAARVLTALDYAWRTGEPWSLAPQSGERRALHRLATDHGIDAARADEMLRVWLATGVVVETVYDTRNKRKGLRVAHPSPPSGIFD